MIIEDKIRDEKFQYGINREGAKYQHYQLEKLINTKNILQVTRYSDQGRIIEQATFTYSPLGKAFEKQIKAIEDQGEKQVKELEQHGKQPVKYKDENEPLMEEIRDLSKQIDFNLSL